MTPLRNWKGSPFLRVYRATSAAIRSDEAASLVREEPAMEAGSFAWYTRYGGDERIRELALEVTGGLTGYAERVQAIEEWLRGNYLYSLHPGVAADGNQLHHFLFESRKGYCSYFAFAMALMCRSVGIPARVAVGFLVPRETEVLNFYEVRAFQAHAWVEVWFGDLGWIEFDPTSQELAPGEDFAFFLGPDLDELERLIRQVLEHQDDLEEEQAGTPDAFGDALAPRGGRRSGPLGRGAVVVRGPAGGIPARARRPEARPVAAVAPAPAPEALAREGPLPSRARAPRGRGCDAARRRVAPRVRAAGPRRPGHRTARSHRAVPGCGVRPRPSMPATSRRSSKPGGRSTGRSGSACDCRRACSAC